MAKIIWLAEKYFIALLIISIIMLFFSYHYYWVLTLVGSIVFVAVLWKLEDRLEEERNT